MAGSYISCRVSSLMTGRWSLWDKGSGLRANPKSSGTSTSDFLNPSNGKSDADWPRGRSEWFRPTLSMRRDGT